jgi:ribosomal protein L24E
LISNFSKTQFFLKKKKKKKNNIELKKKNQKIKWVASHPQHALGVAVPPLEGFAVAL